MLLAKYDKTQLCYSVTLHRYYCGQSPSDVGTPALYDERLNQLDVPPEFKRILLEGLDIYVHDMDDERLDAEVAAGQANLQNVYAGQNRQKQPGYGLYWNRDKLQLAVFHDGWVDNISPSPNPIKPHNIIAAADTLSHELGHHYSWLIDFNRGTTFASKEISRILIGMMIPQASTPEENLAEHFRYLFGCRRTINTFSDGSKTNADLSKLKIAMIIALYLYPRLKNRIFSDLKFDGSQFTWNEHSLETFWLFTIAIPVYKTAKFSMGVNGVINQN